MKKFFGSLKKPEVSIAIVSFNTERLLGDCLASIFQDAASTSWEVIVIDNGSTDNSVQMVKRRFPQVEIVENGINVGFSRAENQGLRVSRGKYIFFLNSDTRLKRGAISDLTKYLAEHSGVGLVGPKLVNPDKSRQESCFYQPGVVNTIKGYWFGEKHLVEKYCPQTDVPTSVESVVGAAMMMPKSLADKLGGFDEKFFFYFEDIDLCQRVRKLGLKTVYYPKAEVVHYHGASGHSESGFGYLRESILYPLKKLFGRWNSSSSQSYLVESSIVYFGWLRHLLITVIIKLSGK